MRRFLVGDFDTPVEGRLAVAGYQQLGIDNPQLRRAGLELLFRERIPLGHRFEGDASGLGAVELRAGIQAQHRAYLTGHRCEALVVVQIDQQFAGQDRHAGMGLAIAVARAAAALGRVFEGPGLAVRAGKAKQGAELSHRCPARLFRRRRGTGDGDRGAAGCADKAQLAGARVDLDAGVSRGKFVRDIDRMRGFDGDCAQPQQGKNRDQRCA